MILVVDANILFAALIKSGFTKTLLLISDYSFFAPEFSITEFKKHLPELEKKTGLSKEELKKILDDLIETAEIKLIPFEEFKYKTKLAKSISPDIDDVAYFALALHLNCAIWSNDKEMKKQNKVKIINTKELFEKIKGT